MAEVAATAIGIAGVVGVLQSLLQCYKDFLTARNFEGDFAYMQLRAALLENSTTTWAIAVGLIDDSGVSRNKFLVARPTEQRAELVKATLDLIRKQLVTTNTSLATYTNEVPAVQDASNAEDLSTASIGQSDKLSRAKRIASKLHRMVQKRCNEQHPGFMKQTVWGLIDKDQLEADLDKVTTLVDRLNTDFAPLNQKQQLDRYCQDIKDLRMNEEDIREVGEIPGDRISRAALKMLDNERSTGNRFIGTIITKEGKVSVGDFYDKDWQGTSMVKTQSRNNRFEDTSVTDSALLFVGNIHGGKSPMDR
ncbi:prion-inhibition and propagation-domain-containing protein [Annulohypoxylon truncatum]|uniref:prion-inhibition and propagation-domain-containing protein n=1 Tax=Annulohypoxylon truncatum TaxID=327061 RepID=UPI00200852F4|nr:prion-inhibition and propagation-domain-containing protein [Annulohypoxylon truncatum]KAI1207283.1 prion-inhibition and propagation-domain-containing protein [Annulohypoxylon truncatum]